MYAALSYLYRRLKSPSLRAPLTTAPSLPRSRRVSPTQPKSTAAAPQQSRNATLLLLNNTHHLGCQEERSTTLSCIRVCLFIILITAEITGFSFRTYSSWRVIIPPAVKVLPRDFNLTTSPHTNQHFEQREYHATRVGKALKNPVITMC